MEDRAELQHDRVERRERPSGVRVIDVHWPTAVIEQDIAAVQIAVLDAARHIDLKILDGRQVDGTEMMVVHLQRHVADQRPPNSRNAYPLNLARAMPSRLI